MIDEEKLENIITVVEENLDYLDTCSHSDNCEVSGIILGKQRDKVKNWIREIIEGN